MPHARGFTIVEAVVASAIVITALASLTQLAVATRQATSAARARSTATLLAVDKMEELRSAPSLAPSPPDALDRDVDAFSDRIVGFTRRWWVQPLPWNPAGGLVVQVRVLAAHGVDARLVSVRAARAD
ncbi:MAG TPA: hypothetical protein VFB07_02000 [Vicinamibacterales bacterium]|nr:hypothetical protein [Vicinamibacterales bacterium]